MTRRPLAGRSVLVTREQPGELARLLDERGARVIHLPLIATTDAADGGAALDAALGDLEPGDWLLVTSVAGAERVGRVARDLPAVRLGAVGRATARRLAILAERAVEVVPERQLAEEFAEAVIAAADEASRILIAQADRAADTLADRLRAAGHSVTAVVAYRTVSVRPDAAVIAGIDSIDVLALASGSAAESWAESIGADTLPQVVVAIGPSTAAACERLGVRVDAVAGEHTVAGLVAAIEAHFAEPGNR